MSGDESEVEASGAYHERLAHAQGLMISSYRRNSIVGSSENGRAGRRICLENYGA